MTLITNTTLIEKIAATATLEQAYLWLCSARKECHFNNDVWHQLRTVVRLMNRCLVSVKQTKHPFKTYIGKIKESGFDFLGYRIAIKNVNTKGLAWKSWANHFSKIQQLYEQGAKHKRIAEYTKRWLIWVRSGVTVNLQQLVKYGLKSDIGKSLSNIMPLADFYRQAGVVGL